MYNVYLMRVVPTFTPMNPVTATCFLFTAAALIAYTFKVRYARQYCQSVGILLVFVGVTMLVYYLFHIDMHVDQLLFHSKLHGNRIAPNTAFNLTLTGLALLLYDKRWRWGVVSIAAVTTFISTFSIIGYLYGLKQLFGISNFNPMAIHTAVCFLLINMALASILFGGVRLYIDRKIIITLLLVLAVVVGVNMISVQILKEAANYEAHVDRSRKIIAVTNEVELSLADAETGQRGYLLTDKASYLQPYEASKKTIVSQMNTLRTLMIKDGRGSSQSDSISRLITLKLAELDSTIQLRKQNNPAAALRIVNSDKGKRYSDAARAQLQNAEEVQDVELASAQKGAAQRRQDALWIVSITTAIDIVLVIGVFLFIQQSIKRRLSAEKDLSRSLDELRIAKSKDEALLNSIGDAVFAIDAKGCIALFNPAAARISGFSIDDAIGQPYEKILSFELEKTGEPSTKFIEQAFAGKVTSMDNHTLLVRKDGVKIPVADSAAPLVNTSGQIQGVIVVFRDISKEHELDRAKDEFVSLASHQLRTPLSAINWYGEMLLHGDVGKLKKEQAKFAQEMFDGTQRMIELVNSLLDVSRLEVGKMANDPESQSANELVESLEKELAPSIKARQLTIVDRLHHVRPVIADRKLLRMIVQNLLSNAVKYTPDNGTVTVTLRAATAADIHEAALHGHAGNYWYFSVQDTGYGIPKDEQVKIFSKLYRAANVRRLDVEGTGLGLYIVKDVVEKMGGKVWFTSEEGKGSTFYVVLPFHSRSS